MKRIPCLAAALALVGCGAADPCDGKPAVCIAVHVRGSVPALDELRVTVEKAGGGPLQGDTGLVMPRITLPVQFALRLPQETTGALEVSVAGIEGADTIARGMSSVAVPASGHGRVDVFLQQVTGGDGGGGQDGDANFATDGSNVNDASRGGDGSLATDGSNLSDGGTVSLGPDPLDFGEVAPGQVPLATLTLQNGGPPTTLGGITLSGSSKFTQTGGTCQPAQAINTGGSCTLEIGYTAGGTPGAASGHVDVAFGTDHVGAELSAHTSGWIVETLSSPSPSPVPAFFTVWGTSTSDVWAAGSGGSLYHRSAAGHWAPPFPTPPPWSANASAHVFTPAAGVLYVAANALYYSTDGAATWKHLADAFATDHAVKVFGLDASTVFAGSDNGRLEIGSGAGGFVFDGLTNQPIIDNLFGAGQQAYALAGNHVFQRNGANLWVSSLDESANAVLEGGFAVAPGNFYVAARLTSASCSPACAAIFHVTAAAGTPQTALGGTQLTAVWGNSAADLWAVGKGGTVYHSAGNDNWVAQTVPTSNDLNAVWGSNGEIFAVGVSGTILHHY